MNILLLRGRRFTPDIIISGSITERPNDSRRAFSRDYAAEYQGSKYQSEFAEGILSDLVSILD